MLREVGRPMEATVWFLTSNQGKLEEAQLHFAPLGYNIEQLIVPEDAIIEPQSDSLQDIAISKLEQAKAHLPDANAMVMVEDSGLFINALDGFPGVYSSYVHETIGCQGILRLLAHLESDDPVQHKKLRGASYHAVTALWDGTSMFVGLGECPGSLASEMHEGHGFGYDPVFVPLDLDDFGQPLPAGELGSISTHGMAFGGVELDVKHRFSHRRRALEHLLEQLP